MEGLERIPFFDNHTHELDYDKTSYTETELSISFLHGFRDLEGALEGGEDWVSEAQAYDLEQLGVVKTMVCHMSKQFHCAPTLAAVTQHRNEITKNGQWEYARKLYEEQYIIGTMVDSGLPMGDEKAAFPCHVYRLYRMDPVVEKLLLTCGSYRDLKHEFLKKITDAEKEGYAGVKCHIGELYTLAVYPVTEYEAEKAYPSALLGDGKANEIVYFALFSELMKLCGELDLPIHIHTGCTGGSGNGKIQNLNPFLMAPYLNNREYQKTKIIFLHSSYPHVRNAALMAHMFPNVWMDMSWALPWTSLDFAATLQSVLAVAPHSRILFGSGQHGIPEMSWIAAKTARSSLGYVLDHAVTCGTLTKEQALDTAEMILYKNASRLYHF